MLVGIWACQRVSALRVCLWMHPHATLPPPPPLHPHAHNFADFPNELLGITEVYEGDDATSAVEAHPFALTVSNDSLVLSVLVLDGGGGGQMSFRYMMNRLACNSHPPFFGEVGKCKHHAC